MGLLHGLTGREGLEAEVASLLTHGWICEGFAANFFVFSSGAIEGAGCTAKTSSSFPEIAGCEGLEAEAKRLEEVSAPFYQGAKNPPTKKEKKKKGGPNKTPARFFAS